MIRLVVTVPLELPQQWALEQATHAALDADPRDWAVSVSPFMTMDGCLLEATAGREPVERRLLDVLSGPALEAALRQIARRSRRADAPAPQP